MKWLCYGKKQHKRYNDNCLFCRILKMRLERYMGKMK